MRVADVAFERVFQHLFVYNILWEDSEVDERFLGIDEDSTILGISGAGCRIAGHLSQHPRSVDAVDTNRYHLALTALKVAAASQLRSYDTFYELLGRGSHAEPETLVGHLVGSLPHWMQKHWSKHHTLFSRSLHERGLTAGLLANLRKRAGVDEAWLRSVIPLAPETRRQMIRERFEPVLQNPWVRWFIESPAHLFSLGVNYAQCKRMLATEGASDLVGFLLLHLERVATTDLVRNWFVWYSVAGQFNHDEESAVPPYLRRDRHERSRVSPTEVHYHRRNIFDVLEAAPAKTWSHFTFCDAPDWMSESAQRRLFEQVLRTSRDGGVVQYRTVETESIVERLGLDRHLVPMLEETAQATALDRTRQYRGVRYYRIVH